VTRKIAILGSTGSIGTQTLEVVRDHPDAFQVVGLSAYRNEELLLAQIEEFKPKIATLESSQRTAASANGAKWASPGLDGLVEVATHPDVETVVVATVGAAGLVPTLEALRAGKTVALANKEVLVMGGEFLMGQAGRFAKSILPIDSEHSAIFQCLQGENRGQMRRIVVTASGGPFHGWDRERIRNATPKDALNHPVWSMGRKITVDSATLMNKGLEIIEAHHLFGLPCNKIDVVIHPQSIIHSMVEFADGAVMAQMGLPDMKVPIQFALSYPDRLPRSDPPLDLPSLASLTFEKPDLEKFRCLSMAYTACQQGGGYPAVLSVANEEAVNAFLEEAITFDEIEKIIDEQLQAFENPGSIDLETILAIERETRRSVRERLGQSVMT